MAGTYLLRAGAVNTNSGPNPWHHGGIVFDANWGAPPAPGEYLLRFDVDTAAIVLDGGAPISQASLPAGFRPTTAIVRASMQSNSNIDGDVDAYLQFGPVLDEGPVIHVHTSLAMQSYIHPGPVPSAVNLINDGMGVRVVIEDEPSQWAAFVYDGDAPFAGSVAPFHIFGDYIIEAWYYSPSLDDYVLGEDPGGDYEAVDTPTPRIDSIVPNEGPIAGGTAFTITGAGFLNPDGEPGVESVMFDGEFPATSVVVIDSQHLTGVTPAHWKGTYHVVVNLAFTP